MPHKSNFSRLATAGVDILPLLASISVLCFWHSSLASADTFLDFEGLPDSTIVTNQFPGTLFQNAVILSAGITLNELEFPPHSGTNVLSDNGGPIGAAFSTPVTTFEAYFTYLEPVTLRAFDAANTQIAIVSSAFSSNDALFGDPGSSPNELLFVTSSSGIESVTISGDLAGNSFAMDDVAIIFAAPEPSTFAYLVGAASIAFLLRQKLNLYNVHREVKTYVLETRGGHSECDLYHGSWFARIYRPHPTPRHRDYHRLLAQTKCSRRRRKTDR